MAFSWKRIYQEAIVEASRALFRHGIKSGSQGPVDIFSAIQADNIVLMFQPLGNLAGVYIPSEGASVPAGILINENLPVTRQRFSAAHEYCHHLRKDPPSLDTENDLFSSKTYKRDDRERIAESFAAVFLMPLYLIKNTMACLDIKSESIRPVDVYNLSLRLESSYIATVNQLRNYELITERQQKSLIGVPPKLIKESIGSEGLLSSWNDVWVVTSEEDGSILKPKKGDTLRFSFLENPNTGYMWEFDISIDDKQAASHPTDRIDVEGDKHRLNLFETSCNRLQGDIGGEGLREFIFQVQEAEDILLQFSYLRPWLREFVDRNLKFNIHPQEKRHGIDSVLLTG